MEQLFAYFLAAARSGKRKSPAGLGLWQSPFHLIPLSFFLALLGGCAGDIDNNNASSGNQNTARTLLADLVIGDTYLRSCLDAAEIDGIQYVDEFTYFNCSIDTGEGFEQLTAIETLRLGFVPGSTIDYLDTTPYPNLKELYKVGSSNLTYIDLSSNSQLETLHFQERGITAIDLRNNPNLKTLRLAELQISEIDLSQNPKIETLQLYDTNLSEIDLSNNIELKEMDLAYNDISEIDLSHNTHMTRLIIRDTNISEVDVRLMPDLIYLSFAGAITDLDLSGNPVLETLSLAGDYYSCETLENLWALHPNIKTFQTRCW